MKKGRCLFFVTTLSLRLRFVFDPLYVLSYCYLTDY